MRKLLRNCLVANKFQLLLGNLKRVRRSYITQTVGNNSHLEVQVQSLKNRLTLHLWRILENKPASVHFFLFRQINFPLQLIHYVMSWIPFDAIVEQSSENKAVTKEPTTEKPVFSGYPLTSIRLIQGCPFKTGST